MNGPPRSQSLVLMSLLFLLPVPVTLNPPVLATFHVNYNSTLSPYFYQYDAGGVAGLRVVEYRGDIDSLNEFNLNSDNTLLASESYADCIDLSGGNCVPWTLNSLSMQDGSGRGYYNCSKCRCLNTSCTPGAQSCDCDELAYLRVNYTFNKTDRFSRIICGQSQNPRGSTEWQPVGGNLSRACLSFEVDYYGVDNDEAGLTAGTKVDSVRDQSWNYFVSPAVNQFSAADTICDSDAHSPGGPGDYGDRCWGSMWGLPVAGFCAKDASGSYQDGVCFDGTCAFAIDDQVNASTNLEIWDSGTLGYKSTESTNLESLIQHFCTGYSVTNLEVSTFCADRNANGWEATTEYSTCSDGVDNDGDGWTNEFFRWTDENSCVECDPVTHAKNNCSLFSCNYTLPVGEKSVLCEIGCGAEEDCDEVPPSSFSAEGAYCNATCQVSRPCPHNEVPDENESCYNPGVYNWGFCTNCSSGECGLNTCPSPGGDIWCGVVADSDTTCHCVARFNLTLDIGDDGTLEWWNNSLDFTNVSLWKLWNPGMEAEVVSKINNILEAGCADDDLRCNGCRVEGDDCLIPFVFATNRPNESIGEEYIINGTLVVSGVNFRFWQLYSLADVGYGITFPSSDGGNWMFNYDTGGGQALSPYMKIPQSYGGSDPHTYSYGSEPAGDAMDDAMYRLLANISGGDSTVDQFAGFGDIYAPFNREYPFNASYMWFDGTDVVRSMNLFGPVEVKLVVWS